MTKINCKNYNISNNANLSFYELINRLDKILLRYEFDEEETENDFAFSDGIVFKIIEDNDKVDILVNYDTNYFKNQCEIMNKPASNLRKVKPIKFEKYSMVKFRGFEWYVLDISSSPYGTIKLLLKDVLNEDYIKKYGTEPLRSEDNKVSFALPEEKICWQDSYIKNVVLNNFLQDLDVSGKISLFQKYQLLTYPKNIIQSNTSYWTASVEGGKSQKVYFVDLNGKAKLADRTLKSALRPIITISKKDLITELQKEEAYDK